MCIIIMKVAHSEKHKSERRWWRKLKPRCTDDKKCRSFENFNCKGTFVSSCVCVYVWLGCILAAEWLKCIYFGWVFFRCVVKLLDSLSIISPDHCQKIQAVPPVYVAAKSFWRFYEVRAYITSSHSLQIEYWLMISSLGLQEFES